ncbi:MAG: dephospho-CoA kinase [Janthinobacterium lividum]
MLRVGLTGGIGAGKSTVARRLVERGAVLVDADVIAREVVARGTPGLAAVVARFGSQFRTAQGDLDRPALGRHVFADEDERRALNAIVHPLVAARRDVLTATTAPGSVVVDDIPLLVETGTAPSFPIVVVVTADVDERTRRLVEERGMSAADAGARIAAQAGDAERQAAADIVVANPRSSGTDLQAVVDSLYDTRLLPFAANLAAHRRAPRPRHAVLVAPDAGWPARAARVLARIGAIAGERALSLEHIGSTAVPGLEAKDVLDVQVVVRDLAGAAELADDLLAAGLVRAGGRWFDRLPDGGTVDKAFAANADPGLAVNCHLRPADSPAARHVLFFRDALRADARLRAGYAHLKEQLAAAPHASVDDYAQGKSAFVDRVLAQS